MFIYNNIEKYSLNKKVKGEYWEHICEICKTIWYSQKENPKVCSNVLCTNRTHWKDGNKRK